MDKWVFTGSLTAADFVFVCSLWWSFLLYHILSFITFFIEWLKHRVRTREVVVIWLHTVHRVVTHRLGGAISSPIYCIYWDNFLGIFLDLSPRLLRQLVHGDVLGHVNCLTVWVDRQLLLGGCLSVLWDVDQLPRVVRLKNVPFNRWKRGICSLFTEMNEPIKIFLLFFFRLISRVQNMLST